MIKSGPIPAGSPGVIAILIGVLINLLIFMILQLRRKPHLAFRGSSSLSLLQIYG